MKDKTGTEEKLLSHGRILQASIIRKALIVCLPKCMESTEQLIIIQYSVQPHHFLPDWEVKAERFLASFLQIIWWFAKPRETSAKRSSNSVNLAWTLWEAGEFSIWLSWKFEILLADFFFSCMLYGVRNSIMISKVLHKARCPSKTKFPVRFQLHGESCSRRVGENWSHPVKKHWATSFSLPTWG